MVATGRYIGEGVDEPRLDTLFLAMFISWRGTLQQYAGRLHRLFENTKEVQIFDYVDIHGRTLEKMYRKRLAGYAAIGYRAKVESIAEEPADIIFDNANFLPVYHNERGAGGGDCHPLRYEEASPVNAAEPGSGIGIDCFRGRCHKANKCLQR